MNSSNRSPWKFRDSNGSMRNFISNLWPEYFYKLKTRTLAHTILPLSKNNSIHILMATTLIPDTTMLPLCMNKSLPEHSSPTIESNPGLISLFLDTMSQLLIVWGAGTNGLHLIVRFLVRGEMVHRERRCWCHRNSINVFLCSDRKMVSIAVQFGVH